MSRMLPNRSMTKSDPGRGGAGLESPFCRRSRLFSRIAYDSPFLACRNLPHEPNREINQSDAITAPRIEARTQIA